MSAFEAYRGMADCGERSAGWRGFSQATTEERQDKRPQCVRLSVGCFCRVFRGTAHIVVQFSNVRHSRTLLIYFGFWHLAGHGHGR